MKQHYLLVNILDASGSMASLANATIKGYNQYLKAQEEHNVNLVYTVTFNTGYQVVRELNDLKNGELHPFEYLPIGGTALYDAIGTTIEQIDQLLSKLAKKWNVIVNIITDGEENASQKYSEVDIQNIIETHQNKGWLFMYAGAHAKAKEEGRKMRIRPENILEVKANNEGINDSFAAFEKSTYYYKNGK